MNTNIYIDTYKYGDIHVQIHIHTQSIHACMYKHDLCAHVYVYVYIYIYIYVCTYVRTYVRR